MRPYQNVVPDRYGDLTVTVLTRKVPGNSPILFPLSRKYPLPVFHLDDGLAPAPPGTDHLRVCGEIVSGQGEEVGDGVTNQDGHRLATRQ